MNDEVKLWLQILTEGRIAIEPAQAHAILWLAIGNAALALERAIKASAPAPKPVTVPVPKAKKAKKRTGRPASPKSAASKVLAAIKAGAVDYAALKAALPKVEAKLLYRAADQLVERGQITRTRKEGKVSLAAR